MELAGDAREKHLVLLAGTGPAGKGVNEFCWLWEAGSSLLSWSRQVTGEAKWQLEREKSLVRRLLAALDPAVLGAGAGGLAWVLNRAGHSRQAQPLPLTATVWAMGPELRLERQQEPSACSLSTVAAQELVSSVGPPGQACTCSSDALRYQACPVLMLM